VVAGPIAVRVVITAIAIAIVAIIPTAVVTPATVVAGICMASGTRTIGSSVTRQAPRATLTGQTGRLPKATVRRTTRTKARKAAKVRRKTAGPGEMRGTTEPTNGRRTADPRERRRTECVRAVGRDGYSAEQRARG
jgi:hypothetical protein